MALYQKHTQKLLIEFKKMDSNPYVFSIEKTEDSPSSKIVTKRLPHEDEILLEQRRTMFESDSLIKETFQEDFEAYNLALDDPEVMILKLEESVENIRKDLDFGKDQDFIGDWWQDEFLEQDSNIEFGLDEDLDANFSEDELYQKSDKWARRLFKVGNTIYEDQGKKDPDLFRVLVNIFLIPSKIAYASCGDDQIEFEDDDSEIQISLCAYSLALVFLRRVRESLISLELKNFSPKEEWRGAVLASDEIAIGIQNRMISLAKKLKKG